MATLSLLELQTLDTLLNEEEMLVRKYATLSAFFSDPQLKVKFEQASARHQDHINRLMGYLS